MSARKGLLPAAAELLARASARLVPDAFSIASLLTLLTVALAVAFGQASPAGCLRAWGDGFWSLLGFSMQIAVVIFAGYLLAVSPVVRRLLDLLAAVPRTPRQAVAWTALVSMLLCWLNWGMGLIASAVLVRSVARRHPRADYRLLVAVAYLGLGTTWHAGPSGSVPLLLATPGSFMVKDGLISAPIPLAATIFTTANLALMLVVVAALTAFAARLHPREGEAVVADPRAVAALAVFEPPARPPDPSPAERLMHGPWLNGAIGLMGVGYVLLQLGAPGGIALTLDTVNLIALSLAVLFHPSPASIAKAAEDAARPLHGVVLQFPLYAGIYGIIKGTGLAAAAAQLFISLATARTYPFVVFVYSAILNYWVPSGGAKWAMEAPYILKAGGELGVPIPATVMAYAYGDMATNLIQPFWAIPLLGVARLDFRDILGYELLVLAVYGTLVGGALLLLPR